VHRALERDDDVGAEVGFILVDRLAERHVHRPLAPTDDDAQVRELVLELAPDGVGRPLLQLIRSLPTRAVLAVGVRDDDADVDVGQRRQRVAVGDRAVEVAARVLSELAMQRGGEPRRAPRR
jgi:hypothetical protein